MCEKQIIGSFDRKHVEWIDAARSFAIACVVLCHVTEGIYQLDLEYISCISVASSIFCFIAFTVGRCGVPIFLMISGYLLLDRTYNEEKCKKFWRNNWLGLVICYELWNLIYNILLVCIYQEKISIIHLIQEELFLRQVGFSHMWYMPMIIGVYVLIPFVANALSLLNCRTLLFPITVFFVSIMIFPVINVIIEVLQMESVSMKLSEGFSGGGIWPLFNLWISDTKKFYEKISEKMDMVNRRSNICIVCCVAVMGL